MKKVLIALVVVSVAFVGLYSTVDNADALYRVPSRVDSVSKTIIPNFTFFTISNTNGHCIFTSTGDLKPLIKYSTIVNFESVDGAYFYNLYRNGTKVTTIMAGGATSYNDVFVVSSSDATYNYNMIAANQYGRVIGVSNVTSIFVPGNCAYTM